MTAPGRILLTGASGFVGAAVLRSLSASGTEQTLILAGRSPKVASSSTHQHARLDLLAPALALPEGIDTVLHLAGEKRDTSRMDAVNHIGAARLVEAAAKAGARSFIHLSSVGVYGAPENAGVVDESCRHTPQNQYELTKDAGERAVRERCTAFGLRCVVLQPSNVVGIVPGRTYPLLGLARTVARGWFRHFDRGDAQVNYVAVEDVAAVLAMVTLDNEAKGVFIVNTPAPLRKLVNWIASELDVPPPVARLPRWIGAVAAGAGSLGRAVLRRELPFSPERFRELTNTTQYDGSRLTKLLGFKYPVGIEAALRSMIRQYRSDGLL